MSAPTIPPTQYQLTDNVKNALRSVLSAGQSYVNGGAIRVNRSDTSAEVPRLEVDVTNVARASTQMASFQRVIVSGAGTTAANGTYQPNVTGWTNGACNIMPASGGWEILSGITVLYSIPGASPIGAWSLDDGEDPTPVSTASTGYFYNHFAADVSVKVVSDRTDGGAIHHEDMVQSVRYLLSREAQTLVSPVVTWYEVLDVAEQGESHEVGAENREDHSTISFRLELGILPASYAVPSSGHAA